MSDWEADLLGPELRIAGAPLTPRTKAINFVEGVEGEYNPTTGAMDLTVAPDGRGRVSPHDLTHSPVGLWQLNETYADTSGNGLDLAVENGTPKWTEFAPGLAGLHTDVGGVRLGRAVNALLAIVGDMTFEALIQLRQQNGGALLCYGRNTTGRYLYRVSLNSSTGHPEYQHGAAGPSNTGLTLTTRQYPICRPFHFAFTRRSNVIQFYLDGRPFGAPSAALAPLLALDVHASNGFRLGTDSLGLPDGITLASVKLIASGLTSAEVLAEYHRTVGPYNGEYP